MQLIEIDLFGGGCMIVASTVIYLFFCKIYGESKQRELGEQATVLGCLATSCEIDL